MPDPGMSLEDYAEAEAAETPDVSPEPTPEPVVDEPISTEAPDETPNVADETPDVPTDEIADETPPQEPDEHDTDETIEEPDPEADHDDMVVEYSKRGYPIPSFDPNALEGDAKTVQEHWRNVRVIDRREEKAFREKFEGIDPKKAQTDAAAMDELWSAPDYAAARALISDDGKNPRVSIAKALLDETHPQHLQATKLVQQAIAGETPQRPQKLTPPGQLPDGIYDRDTGELDQQKLAAWQAERERHIARVVAARAAENRTPETSPDNGDDQMVRDYQTFCAYEGIDPSTSAPLIERAYNLMMADRKSVPAGPQGFKMLWDRVKDERKSQIAETQAEEVARVKRASTPRPRSATPDSGPPLHGGMTLEQRHDAERASE